MKVTIFKEITTEGVIASIEENSKKYNVGLVANMDNLPERTMVKQGAAEIGDIIKALKTSRIAITKTNTAAVNKEHDAIVARLDIANKPYTDLLNAHKASRKIILDAEDARKKAIADVIYLESRHELALALDENETLRRANDIKTEQEVARQVIINRDNYAAQQVKLAEQKIIDDQLQKEADKRHDEDQRLANVEHVRGVNRSIFSLFISVGLDHDSAQAATQALIDKKVPNTIIHY